MRARRLELGRAHPDAAERAAAWFPAEHFAGVTVGGYRPQGGEMDPEPLTLRLARHGAHLALPVSHARDAPLKFRVWGEADALAPDVFGIPAPTGMADEVTPNIIIVPVLAFDAQGRRLGQGAGSYDRTLAALRAVGPVFAVGLAFAGQELPTCPGEAHDQPLDAILTEAGYREFRAAVRLRRSRRAAT